MYTRLAVFALLTGCAQDDDDPPPDSPPVGPCVGEGSLRGNDGEARNWVTWTVDDQLRTVSEVHWEDSDRTEARFRRLDVYSDDHLVSVRNDLDADGLDDLVELWEYDELGRVVRSEVQVNPEYDVGGTGIASIERWTYRADGELDEREVDQYGDGVIDRRYQYTWVDGRQTRIDLWLTDGVPLVTTRTYAEPAPSLDHVEETRAEGEALPFNTIVRTYDDAGNLLLEDTEYAWGGQHSDQWTWDEAGRPLALLTWAETGASVLHTWVYDDLGLQVRSVHESDGEGDGVIDDLQTTEWDWSCTDA